MSGITATVGLGGENRRHDVFTVQALLEAAGVSPGRNDGRCGRRTIHAIDQFQSRIMARPDGRVDVHGPTIRHLLARPAPRSAAAGARVGGPPALTSIVRGPAPTTIRPHVKAPAGSSPDADPAYVFWRQHTPLPDPSINAGLTCPSSAQMMELFGAPNAFRVSRNIATESVGPFNATGLKPALASMRRIFSRVHHELPDLYGLVESRGMLNTRKIQNTRSYSNHSWGVAIDLKIAGESPEYGDDFSLRGLDALAPYFKAMGWYWGGGYRTASRKDAMHFECGLALVRSFNL